MLVDANVDVINKHVNRRAKTFNKEERGQKCKMGKSVPHCISSLSEHNKIIKLQDARSWSRRPSTALSRGTLFLQKAQSAGRGKEKMFGRFWLSNWHKLLPGNHTNLGGRVYGGVPPFHPSLQGVCALTEGLSAEEQLEELKMTDRNGYGLYWVSVPREYKNG